MPTRDQAVTPDAKARLACADAFMAAHPNVKLVPFQALQIEGMSGMDSGPLMAMAGGIAPQVMYVNFRISETFISQGLPLPAGQVTSRNGRARSRRQGPTGGPESRRRSGR